MAVFEQLLAITRNTFFESIRQPVLLVVLIVSTILVVLSNPFSAYTLQDDQRMYVDIGLSTIFMGGAILSAFVASNVLIVIDSVWPQSVIFWDGVGGYLCRLRDAVNTSVAVVLLSDEYQQAPRFIYSETDRVFKPYVSKLQVSLSSHCFLLLFCLFLSVSTFLSPRRVPGSHCRAVL